MCSSMMRPARATASPGSSTVGLDLQDELVVVGALADTGVLHHVGATCHRREQRVDGDDADRVLGRLLRSAETYPRPTPTRMLISSFAPLLRVAMT
jgi:hypothetical protein